ncbi:unnamed protein product [Linum tenue]|uniref:BHLH domain-containing protein n=1 Tax=Linum tenue TaxID=586396 RepID=A0AAV0K2Q1_9ROSI|nr:unnamed protein product [Linum tenue]
MKFQYSSSWQSVPEQPFSAPLQEADFPASASAAFQGDECFPFAWPENYCDVGSQESIEEKAASSSRSHKQAEKRRRDRINTQLGVLRKLIPNSDKMDKAALLGSAIEQVKELKREAKEAVERNLTIPSEVDEISVDVCQDVGAGVLIRVSVSCEDRPEVMSELIRVVRGQRLEIVRADITSVGGRIKSILILSKNGGGIGGSQGKVCVMAIKHSLNVVLSRIAAASVPTSYRIRSKRQRFFQAAD